MSEQQLRAVSITTAHWWGNQLRAIRERGKEEPPEYVLNGSEFIGRLWRAEAERIQRIAGQTPEQSIAAFERDLAQIIDRQLDVRRIVRIKNPVELSGEDEQWQLRRAARRAGLDTSSIDSCLTLLPAATCYTSRDSVTVIVGRSICSTSEELSLVEGW